MRLVNFTGIHVFHMFLYSLLQQSTVIFFPVLVLKPLPFPPITLFPRRIKRNADL